MYFKFASQSDNDQSSRDTNKRKHEKEEEEEAVDSENSCPKLSPSLFSSPESSQKSQPKRFSHLKVRPILPAVDDDGDVVPNVENKFDFAKKSLELKTELIKYYKTVSAFDWSLGSGVKPGSLQSLIWRYA